MAGSDRSRPQSTPESMQGPSKLGGGEQWAMKALNDLREDIRGVEVRLSAELDKVNENVIKVDQRFSVVERTISKSFWLLSGVAVVLLFMYGAIELVSTYFDVTIDLK